MRGERHGAYCRHQNLLEKIRKSSFLLLSKDDARLLNPRESCCQSVGKKKTKE
jgi:hypothetical protein